MTRLESLGAVVGSLLVLGAAASYSWALALALGGLVLVILSVGRRR